MGFRLSKKKRKDVNACISLIKQLGCDDIHEFSEIARGLGHHITTRDYPTDSITCKDVIELMDSTQRLVLYTMIDEAYKKGLKEGAKV